MLILIYFLALLRYCLAVPTGPYAHHVAPSAVVKNGSYAGVHLPGYDQDLFLGIPFAQPPVGSLRFHTPQPLNSSWEGVHQATTYSPFCVGYGASDIGYDLNEDCLYLNVIRPSGYAHKHKQLPVLVWIFGGGFVQGSASDPRYNLSFIVDHSVAIGEPIIAVSINYRVAAWGFLSGDEVAATGNLNNGLRDQRLALNWLHENIASFGGDPSAVTIWGQSAGAMSVGAQLLAYNGRDDGLFRSAIMNSGGPAAISRVSRDNTPLYKNLTVQAGCSSAPSPLDCLRTIPFSTLNTIINTTTFTSGWGPVIDHDFITTHPSTQLSSNSFVHVPIIIGTNSDEGTTLGPADLNTTSQWNTSLVRSSIPQQYATEIISRYSALPNSELDLQNLPTSYTGSPSYGAIWRLLSTYNTDSLMAAPRRLTTQTWAGADVKAYSYRFNAIPAWSPPEWGVTHFSEVAFAMLTFSGVGYPPVRVPPFEGKAQSYFDLAELYAGDYVSFVSTGDVNAWRQRSGKWAEKFGHVPVWPEYGTGEGVNFVFDANVTSFVEEDVWRDEEIEYLNSVKLVAYDG